MKITKVESVMLDTGREPPMVSITMDLPGWDYVLSLIPSEIEHRDATVKIIRETCQRAILEWVPSVQRATP